MRFELIIVGESLLGVNEIKFLTEDISITEINYCLDKRGRFLPKKVWKKRPNKIWRQYIIHLVDQNDEIIPLSFAMIHNHLIGTNLGHFVDTDGLSKEDATSRMKEERERIDDPNINGKFHLKLTLFDAETFKSHSEKVKELNNRIKEETQRSVNLRKQMEEEQQRVTQSIRAPYEELLQQKNEKIKELTAQQAVTVMYFEERFLEFLESAIAADVEKNTGTSMKDLILRGKRIMDASTQMEDTKDEIENFTAGDTAGEKKNA